ncbi:MAG: hypothetical protein AAF125_01215 [Chloroflexota bacterium]
MPKQKVTWIDHNTPLGSRYYPILHHLNCPWSIASWPVTDQPPKTTITPVARWINGSNVHDLYIKGMTTSDFLVASGLKLSMINGGFRLSKRLSRLLRDYHSGGFFDKADVNIEYLPDNPITNEIWDGSARIHRRLLLALIPQLPTHLTNQQREQTEYDLRTNTRVEFTVLTSDGQLKGHAIVTETPGAPDLTVPQDIKPEVSYLNDQVFVGINPVKSHEHALIDIQSIINLAPFFSIAQLTQWLTETGDLYLTAIQNGHINPMMARIDDADSLNNALSWYVRHYLLAGGHPMWFGGIVRGLIRQHLNQLAHQAKNKFRLPIPAGRYYISPGSINSIDIPRGCCEIDPDYHTLWVNPDDWCAFIKHRTGGADGDDSYLVFPFIDTANNNSIKVLAWRNPNQQYEYILLDLVENSHYPVWTNNDGDQPMPRMNSGHLPDMTKHPEPNYQLLINDETANNDNNPHTPYDINVMTNTINRAIANKGALGAYCNILMVIIAVSGKMPAEPPDYLERIIDAVVKDGADLTPILDWCDTQAKNLISDRTPIPQILANRVIVRPEVDKPRPKKPKLSTNHWLDELLGNINQHMRRMEDAAETLATQTRPPIELFNYAYQQPTPIEAGAGLNQRYHSSRKLRQQRRAATRYMKQFPRHQHGEILLAAAAHLYSSPNHRGGDGAIWMMGEKQHIGRELGHCDLLLEMLKRIGILNQITFDLVQDRVLSYPRANIKHVPNDPITINGVWYNALRALHPDDYPATTRMADVPKTIRDASKKQIEDHARRGSYNKQTWSIHHETDGRLTVHHPIAGLIGYVSNDTRDRLGKICHITIHTADAKDGNLTIIWS